MLYDKDIREPLFDFLEDKYGKLRVFEEKMMGKSRADLLVITVDKFIGIEIKSDADTYQRLTRQVKDYDRYCDYNYVVVGSSHALHIKEHVPEHWGIISVELIEGKVDFYIIREPDYNAARELMLKLSVLWRPELAHIQEINGMYKYKDKSKEFVRNKILEKVPESLLEQQLCDELFERDYATIGEKIADYRKNNNLKPRRRKKKTKRYKIYP